MPSLELDNNSAQYQIRSYQPGRIQVNEQIYTESIILTANTLITQWPPQRIQDLTAINFNIIIELKPEILLLGTGRQMVLLPTALYGDLINHGISVELMDTSAACRTYNILTAENRQVAAALIIA